LVTLAQFLDSSGRHDPTVDSRLGELSHLKGLGERVARAMQAMRRA
jgi:hypothetical protein